MVVLFLSLIKGMSWNLSTRLALSSTFLLGLLRPEKNVTSRTIVKTFSCTFFSVLDAFLGKVNKYKGRNKYTSTVSSQTHYLLKEKTIVFFLLEYYLNSLKHLSTVNFCLEPNNWKQIMSSWGRLKLTCFPQNKT